MNFIDELLKDKKVEWKKLWEVTIWDKKFNGIEKYKQLKVNKYYYYLANDLKKLISEQGEIKILTTNKTNIFANEENVKENITDGEVVCIPWGGNPIIQYYKGKFITGDNRIATSYDTTKLNNKFLFYYLLNNIGLISSFYRGSGIKHPDMSKVLEMKIPIPSLETQEKIVKILDNFTKYVTGKLSLFLIFSNKTSIYKAIPKVHKTLLYGKNIDGLPNIEVLSKRLKGISEITAKIKIRFKYLLLFFVL